MKYEFKCKHCKETITVDEYIEDKNAPKCCNRPMVRVYGANMNIGNLKVR